MRQLAIGWHALANVFRVFFRRFEKALEQCGGSLELNWLIRRDSPRLEVLVESFPVKPFQRSKLTTAQNRCSYSLPPPV